jgi:hypothetical protein
MSCASAHSLACLRNTGISNGRLNEVNVTHAKRPRIQCQGVAKFLRIFMLGRIKNHPGANVFGDARGQ